MNGTEYDRIVRAREYAVRTQLARALVLREAYEAAAVEHARTHGARPSGWFGGITPAAYRWAGLDTPWATRLSPHFEQLRISLNRGIEAISAGRGVTPPIPEGLPDRLRQLGRMCDQARAQLRWYLNAPVSRYDERRPWIERSVRQAIVTYPGGALAVSDAARSEGELSRQVTREVGGAVPEMPAQVILRTGPKAEEYEATLTEGVTADPHGATAEAARQSRGTGKDIGEAARALTEGAGTFAGRAASSVRLLSGGGSGGRQGVTLRDVAVIGGVGAIAVGGLYLFLRTRPSVIAAGKALEAFQKNPDEECG